MNPGRRRRNHGLQIFTLRSRVMKKTRLLLFLALAFGSVGCDHATKQLAQEALSGSAPISLIGDAVRLELAHNPGAFLSLGADMSPALRKMLLIGGVPVLLLLVCGLALRGGHLPPPALAGLALITGGGLANWLDRVLHDGTVTDFVSIGVAGLRTGVFNVADVAIVGGFLLFVWAGRTPRSEET